MASITIRVGAALDSSMLTVLRPFEDAVRRARTTVAKEMKGAGDSMGKEAAAGARKASAAMNAMAAEEVRALQRTASAAMAASQKKTRAEFAAFDARLRASKKAAAAEEADILRVERVAIQSAARRQVAEAKASRARNASIARDAGYGAVSGIGGTFRRGMGIAGEFARGAGVDTSISGLVGRSINIETLATNLANSGFIEGAGGAAGQRQDPKKLIEEVRNAADTAAMAPTAAMEGLQQFTKITGDLGTGRALLLDSMKYARATGTELQDMVATTGEVSAKLGDIPNKGAVILSVIRAIAGQGKVGAVEFSDLAERFSKMASGANQFSGSTADNIAKMGAVMQLARKYGGAANAAEAATAAAGLTNTLKTTARVKEFKKAGVDIYDDRGMMNDPLEIIKASLASKGMNPVAFKRMWANVKGAQGAEALAGIYRQAGGGSTGMAAVQKEIDAFKRPMSEGDINESFKRSMDTNAARAQRFQNEMERAAEGMASRMLPAMEKLTPRIIEASETLGKIAVGAAENPAVAIEAAIVANIAKSAIGAGVSAGIQKMMNGGLGGGVGLSITTAMIAGATVGTIIAYKMNEGNRKGEEDAQFVIEGVQKRLKAAEGRYRPLAPDEFGPAPPIADEESLAALERDRATIQGLIAKGQNPTSDLEVAFTSKTSEEQGEELYAQQNMGTLQGEAKGLSALLAAIEANTEAQRAALAAAKGTQRVEVTNMPAAPMPGVDQGARTGP